MNDTIPLDECQCEYYLPPTFNFHIYTGHYPRQYITLWSIASVSLLVSAIFIIPHLIKLRQAAVRVREQYNEILIPFPFSVVSFLSFYPLFVVFSNWVILLSPLTALAFRVLISLYSSGVLYAFSRLMIMYLGSFKSAEASWENIAPATKYHAALPCCCLAPLIKPSHMTKRHFVRIWAWIRQLMIVGPLLDFASLFPAIIQHHESEQILGLVKLASILLCIYGLQQLYLISKTLLKDYNIDRKFRVVDISFALIGIMQFIFSFIRIPDEDSIYNEHLLRTAYNATAQSAIYMLLSIAYQRFFDEKTALDAYTNMQNQACVQLKQTTNPEQLNIVASADDEPDVGAENTGFTRTIDAVPTTEI